jgi:hypothetical protein
MVNHSQTWLEIVNHCQIMSTLSTIVNNNQLLSSIVSHDPIKVNQTQCNITLDEHQNET